MDSTVLKLLLCGIAQGLVMTSRVLNVTSQALNRASSYRRQPRATPTRAATAPTLGVAFEGAMPAGLREMPLQRRPLRRPFAYRDHRYRGDKRPILLNLGRCWLGRRTSWQDMASYLERAPPSLSGPAGTDGRKFS